MFCDFDRVFHPTTEQRQEHIGFLNKLIGDDLQKNGPNCSACIHCQYVQEIPYNDYLVCCHDNIIVGWNEIHKCDNNRFEKIVIE